MLSDGHARDKQVYLIKWAVSVRAQLHTEADSPGTMLYSLLQVEKGLKNKRCKEAVASTSCDVFTSLKEVKTFIAILCVCVCVCKIWLTGSVAVLIERSLERIMFAGAL